MNTTGKNSRTRRLKSGCKCPITAPAWPECCAKHLTGVVEHNLDSASHKVTEEFHTVAAESPEHVNSSTERAVSVSTEQVSPPVGGGMQPQGGGVGFGDAPRRFPLSKKVVSQILTGEFKLTKRLLREQTEAYLASEGSFKAAKKMLQLLDSDDEDIALKAAKDILDRVGVKDQKESLSELVKTKQNSTVSQDWLERIVDEEPVDDKSDDT